MLAGRIAGTLIAAWDGWRGNMYRLAVDPEQRRSGVARGDERAGGLWTAVGYARDETVERFVRNV